MKPDNCLHVLFCTIFFLSLLSACSPTSAPYRKTEGLTQGTFYHITYQSDQPLDSTIVAELKRFDKSLNLFDTASTISRVNRSTISNVAHDTLFINVFNRSQQISKITNGVFDITVSPLVSLWGFNHTVRKEVTQTMIDSVMQFVGYEKITIDENGNVSKSDPRVQIDCNAIAQGYSCDVMSDLFERHGIDNYLIEIGGEIRARGFNPNGTAWQVGITKPVDDTTGTNNAQLQTVVPLSDRAICTSGNYHKFQIHGDKKIGHEIDPRTGHPAVTDLLSATVIAPDAMTADALATACMVLGLNQSVSLIQSLTDVEAYFIFTTPSGSESFLEVKRK